MAFLGRLSGVERRDHAWGAQSADNGPKLHANRKGRVRASCGSLVRTVSHQGLRTVPLLVRPLLIDLAGTTIMAAAVGGLFIWKYWFAAR